MGRTPKVHDKHKPYGRRKTFVTQLVYIIAAAFWIALICYLQLEPPNWIGWVIIFLPLLVFAIGFQSADELTIEVEDDMFRVNHLALGLIIVLSLFTWISRDYSGDQASFTRLLIFAIVFALLAVMDVWIKKKWDSIVKHIKSILQTLALTILIYALYLYYWNKQSPTFPE